MKKNMTITVLMICFVLFSKPAYAYIDPGTGSLFLQILIAGVVGFLFTLKTFGRNIKSFIKEFTSRRSSKPSQEQKNDDAE